MDKTDYIEKYIYILLRLGAKLGIDGITTTEEQLKQATKIMREEYGVDLKEIVRQENNERRVSSSVQCINSRYLSGRERRRERREQERNQRKTNKLF